MNIPERLIPALLDNDERAIFIEDVFTAWRECVNEYFDPAYSTRTHGNFKTYQAGCTGPLCMVAMRRVKRKQDGNTPSRKYAQIEPVIDYFHETILNSEGQARLILQDELLDAIKPNTP